MSANGFSHPISDHMSTGGNEYPLVDSSDNYPDDSQPTNQGQDRYNDQNNQ